MAKKTRKNTPSTASRRQLSNSASTLGKHTASARTLSKAGAILGEHGGEVSAKVKKASAKGKTYKKPKVVHKPTAHTGTKANKTKWERFRTWLKEN